MRKFTISVIVVARNEEKDLNKILNDIESQIYDHKLIDILLVDSLSEDKTKSIMLQFKKKPHDFNRIVILDNPKRILSAGWNIALKTAQTKLVVRIDAHASIPKDFIKKNIEVIMDGEQISGGARPNIVPPNYKTNWNEILLIAESSMFGSSIAPYRNSKQKKYVKSIFHGVYYKNIFDNVGYLNETLGRTEDNEIHYRIRKAGLKIAYSPSIVSYQYVRSSLKKMLKQKYLNGYWIGLTLKICPQCFSIFHFIPLLFVISLFILLLNGIQNSFFLFDCFIVIYFIAMIINTTASINEKKKNFFILILPVIFFLLHFSYGIGTLCGIITMPFKRGVN